MNERPPQQSDRIDTAAFTERIDALLPSPPAALALAVSGGADSMALTLLAARWAERRNIALHALTVDHCLRRESAAEAQQVAQWMEKHDISHQILTAQGEAPQANIQSQARERRYHLLAQWCGTHGISHVLLGHHRDDQAETFLLRLGRGSGVDGLSAMHAISHHHGLTLLRPLLDTPKQALIHYLESVNQRWLEDPANRNPLFTRSRIRALLPALAEAGIGSATLAATASRMARARDYLESQTRDAAAQMLHNMPSGYLRLHLPAFAALHEEIALRLLAAAIGQMTGAPYRPRFSELHALYTALPAARTLAGCKFEPQGEWLHILREPAAVAPPVPLQTGVQEWDNRFRITVTEAAEGYHLGALGAGGIRHIRDTAPPAAETAALPRTALLTLPAIWHLEKPVLAPHIHYSAKGLPDTVSGAIRIDRISGLGYI